MSVVYVFMCICFAITVVINVQLSLYLVCMFVRYFALVVKFLFSLDNSFDKYETFSLLSHGFSMGNPENLQWKS